MYFMDLKLIAPLKRLDLIVGCIYVLTSFNFRCVLDVAMDIIFYVIFAVDRLPKLVSQPPSTRLSS